MVIHHMGKMVGWYTVLLLEALCPESYLHGKTASMASSISKVSSDYPWI